MDIKNRLLSILESLLRLYNDLSENLADSEKEIYLPKVEEHLHFINTTKQKVNQLNPSLDSALEELIRIHSEILNKYYS